MEEGEIHNYSRHFRSFVQWIVSKDFPFSQDEQPLSISVRDWMKADERKF